MTLGAWAGFSGTAVAADELATALFSPSSVTAETFAKLHGQLDSTFWTGGATIPAWAVQPGTFVAGLYQGFERWQFIYAKQKQSSTLYAVHAGLTTRFFLPWPTRVLLYGYNLWCRQDGAAWSDGAITREEWTLDTYIDGTLAPEMEVTLPHARGDSHAGGGDPGGPTVHETNPDNSAEDRWRFIAPCSAIMPAGNSTTPLLNQGMHRIEVKVNATVAAPDASGAKLATPTGALWMLAVRS
jgi:hypothetical protein